MKKIFPIKKWNVAKMNSKDCVTYFVCLFVSPDPINDVADREKGLFLTCMSLLIQNRANGDAHITAWRQREWRRKGWEEKFNICMSGRRQEVGWGGGGGGGGGSRAVSSRNGAIFRATGLYSGNTGLVGSGVSLSVSWAREDASKRVGGQRRRRDGRLYSKLGGGGGGAA